jgi:heme exporter protein D
MILEFIYFNEYGIFIWPAFFFTFISCLVLFLKSKKEYKKQEKLFLEQFQTTQIIKTKESEKDVFSGSAIY